jgi:hypothetical protein
MNTLTAVVIVLVLTVAEAHGVEPDTAHGRYAFQAVPDGLMRLDTVTGQVSLCAKHAAGWVCTAVADDRAALDAELGRLAGENARLRGALAAHGLSLPDGVTGEAGAGQDLPDDRQLDRVMGFFERLWRHLIDMVRTLQDDWARDKDLEERQPRLPDGAHKEKT